MGTTAREPVPTEVAERGWRGLLAALALFLVLPELPSLQMFAIWLPVSDTAVLLVPAIAICSTLGWFTGGPAGLAIVWTTLAAFSIWPGTSVNAFQALSRGWGLMLAASFGLVGIISLRARFFPRAVSAVALALVFGGVTLALSPRMRARQLDDAVQMEAASRMSVVMDGWRQVTSSPSWRTAHDKDPEFAELSTRWTEGLEKLPQIVRMLYPALLALESIIALALAWALYHRISRTRIGPPLGAPREFRFGDQLVWGFLVGLIGVMLPALGEWRRLSLNLLTFFGALFALRGLGVLTWFFASRRFAIVMLVLAALLGLPVFGMFALGLGLGDVWIDWRTRHKSAN